MRRGLIIVVALLLAVSLSSAQDGKALYDKYCSQCHGDTGAAPSRGLAILARTLSRIFYRRVEVVGLSRLPIARPLVIVGNHGNALVDAMLLLGFLPVPIRFLAKSTLWEHPW